MPLVSIPILSRVLFSLLVGLCVLCWISPIGRACSVPVFRYAIEHWQPDAYIVTVFYKAALTDQQQAWLEKLKSGSQAESWPNVKIVPINVDELSEGPTFEYWQRHKSNVLPAIVVDMPLSAPSRSVAVWSGPLTESNIDGIVSSAIRSELEKRLLASQSVVWLFVDGGHQETDDAAFALLKNELSRLEQSLKLPKIEEEDLTNLSVKPAELKIRFSAMRVSHTDPSEKLLREMLLSIEPDLRDESLKGQAMAVPVFGRGRALYALTGPGINSATIEDACRFLTGACQCTVKAENPGVDLLLSANWDSLVKLSEPKDLDTTLVKLSLDRPQTSAPIISNPVPTIALDSTSEPDNLVQSGVPIQPNVERLSPPTGRSAWIAVGAIGLIAFLISLAMFRRA